MKAKKLLLPVFAAMLMVACDPGFNEEYTIDNQSSHDLVFVWNGSWRYYPNENGLNFDGTYPVPAGTKATLPFSNDLGQTGRNQICASARYGLLGDSVSFVVDGMDTLTSTPATLSAPTLHITSTHRATPTTNCRVLRAA